MITSFNGKGAVITGAGGLLGRAMARTFAQAGMSVVVSDVDAAAAAETVAAVEALGGTATAVVTDVSDRDSMEALAQRSFEVLDEVNLLCLNAGTAVRREFHELTYEDWDRVLGVQLAGVLNGVQAFLPRLIEQGGERHIVTTASMSGIGRADLRTTNAPYVTAKFAVVGLSEVMQPALEPHGIGVSVLCPGWAVPDPAAITTFPMPSAAWYRDNLLDAQPVAAEVLHGVAEGRMYIFPHRAGRAEVEDRHARIMAGFDQAERTSPPLSPR